MNFRLPSFPKRLYPVSEGGTRESEEGLAPPTHGGVRVPVADVAVVLGHGS